MRCKTAIKAVLSISIIGFLLVYAGADKILPLLASSDPYWMALALLMTPACFILRFVRWDMLVRLSGKRLPFLSISSTYLIGAFFGMVTPSKIGELVKFHYLSKQGMPKGSAFSLSIFDRVFDIVVVAAFAVPSVFLISGGVGLFGPSVVVFIILLAAAFYSVINRKIFMRVTGFVMSHTKALTKAMHIKQDVTEKNFEEFYAPLRAMKARPLLLLLIAAMSVLIWVSVFFQIYFIMEALGYPVSMAYCLASVCIGTIIGLIPITISGIGTRDAVVVAIFSAAGISGSVALLSSLLYMFIGMVAPSILGGLLYMRSGNPAGIRSNRKVE